MNILLLTSHAIAEHDDLDMFTRMPGVDVFSIGGAYDAVPFEGKRPAVPDVQRYPALEDVVGVHRGRMEANFGAPGPRIDWAKARLAPEVVDWADVIIVHHFPLQWIGGQWSSIRDKRVIWRTCGQSDPGLEHAMLRFRNDGLQVVRYSPKEREAFPRAGAFAGEDAMIRFGKDPDEWGGWIGDEAVVGNITQNMVQRGDACGWGHWAQATEGLPVMPAGPGSTIMRGGIGQLDFDAMQEYLRHIAVYFYTGTRPASYTLGLIEAMMTGVPVISINGPQFGPDWIGELWEGQEICGNGPLDENTDPVGSIRHSLEYLMRSPEARAHASGYARKRAIELFGLSHVTQQWADFLGVEP